MNPLSTFLHDTFKLSPKVALEAEAYFQEEKLGKNESLCTTSSSCKKMSLIADGYLRFYSYSEGKEITHWIFGQGHMITDVGSFFLDQPTKWNINALNDTTLFTLTQENYARLKADLPEWKNQENLFLIKLMSALENRIYALISMSTEQRYHYLYEADREMFNKIPLQYIASMLGMSPETLSRIRRKSIS